MGERERVDKFVTAGTKVDEVVLHIDYQIIEHFSRHLYGSPNKAIEELVANGFDAFATEVYVYTPGRFTPQHVAVWDNGWSMDVSGLKGLWLIASSPKDALGRVAEVQGRGKRDMIGKFGIGKLASYAVGNTITHLCRKGDEFLVVSVDYRQAQGATSQNPLKMPIARVTEPQARRFVDETFANGEKPAALKLFTETRWTLAVVGDLKVESLPQGRLAWVLGNGMPLRPDFKAWVNDEEVITKLEKNADVEWDFGSEDVRKGLEAEWDDAREKGKVKGSLTFGTTAGMDPWNSGKEVPYALFPNLGKVWGTIRLFDESLIKGRQADQDRSYGFFLMVRGRLLNVNDAKVLLPDPSFGTFYRSQFVFHVDALDEELLADRERLRDSPRTQELALLQGAVYRAARAEIENRDERAAEAQRGLALLPVRSRVHYRQPLVALLMKAGPEAVEFDLGSAKVERKALGADHPLAELSSEGFSVNVSHPYYQSLEQRLGKSKKAEEFYRVYGLFAVADLLLQGHLYDIGLSDEKVRQVVEWRDGLFRELAQAYEAAPPELAMELVNTSYVGGDAFEDALAAVLSAMGFSAERRGGPGKEDVYLLASVGPGTYAFTFEAKGSAKPVGNDDADIGAAGAHRDADKVKAEHAIIVARQFVGFDTDGEGEPAIMKECRSAGRVSIMTVEALNELLAAMSAYGYPLDMLKDVFTELQAPGTKLRRIRALQSPTTDFDYRALLEAVWDRQHKEAKGDVVPYRAVWQDRPAWKGGMEFEEFERRLVALETLASGRIRMNQAAREIHLVQAPELIVQQIEKSLERR